MSRQKRTFKDLSEGIGIRSSFLSDNLFWEENSLLKSAMEIYGMVGWL